MLSQSFLGGAAAVTVRSKIARAFGVLQGFTGLVCLSRVFRWPILSKLSPYFQVVV